jgi:hypothetical protein
MTAALERRWKRYGVTDRRQPFLVGEARDLALIAEQLDLTLDK